jgi:hypothetical protein
MGNAKGYLGLVEFSDDGVWGGWTSLGISVFTIGVTGVPVGSSVLVGTSVLVALGDGVGSSGVGVGGTGVDVAGSVVSSVMRVNIY